MDDPELKNLLRENIKLGEENNRMLRYMYRSARWSTVFSIIRWAIIIGLAIGAFYYLKPVIDRLSASYVFLTGHQLPTVGNFFGK
ncbi:MAG TPA: hypothetical protein VFA52_00735 [Candidatus Paceibacterota bacterium]|nr:hypothetical protein [Candidatus Paceibacterota bacterium]